MVARLGELGVGNALDAFHNAWSGVRFNRERRHSNGRAWTRPKNLIDVHNGTFLDMTIGSGEPRFFPRSGINVMGTIAHELAHVWDRRSGRSLGQGLRHAVDGHNVPCAAPCWQGITPGVTDEATAMAILSGSDLINQEALDCHISSYNPLQIYCAFWRVSKEGGGVGFANGIVNLVRLHSEVTLGEMLTALGPPDFISARHGSQLLNEGKCYNAHAYYLKGQWCLVEQQIK
jgi:hypothetical protein